MQEKGEKSWSFEINFALGEVVVSDEVIARFRIVPFRG
jgi:hypothetical protein